MAVTADCSVSHSTEASLEQVTVTYFAKRRHSGCMKIDWALQDYKPNGRCG